MDDCGDEGENDRQDAFSHELELKGAFLGEGIAREGEAFGAFDRFYAEELGSETYEAGAESVITDVLDALMFGDDPGFRLDEEGLRALVAQLDTL